MTKNDGFPYYFLFTLLDYPSWLELGTPAIENGLECFKRLSELIGPQKVIWRYDPIVITARTPIEFHKQTFQELATALGAELGERLAHGAPRHAVREHEVGLRGHGRTRADLAPANAIPEGVCQLSVERHRDTLVHTSGSVTCATCACQARLCGQVTR